MKDQKGAFTWCSKLLSLHPIQTESCEAVLPFSPWQKIRFELFLNSHLRCGRLSAKVLGTPAQKGNIIPDLLNSNAAIHIYQARARSARARRACALRALGLLLADGTPTVGRGKTF